MGDFAHDIITKTTENKYDIIYCYEIKEFNPVFYNGEYVIITCGKTESFSYWISIFQEHGFKLDVNLTNSLKTIATLECPTVDNEFAYSGLVFVKDFFVNKDNATITWASGDRFCYLPEFKIYLKSLSKFDSFDKLIFTHDMSIETRLMIEDYGFRIIDANPNKLPSVKRIVRDRYLIYAEFLQNCRYKKVILTDSKDVVFQADPFVRLEENSIYLVNEGMLHKQSDWNINDQSKWQQSTKNFTYDFEDWCVINGGSIFGDKDLVREICFSVWIANICSKDLGTDQATINYLYHTYYKNDKRVKLVNPNENNLMATGEPIVQGIFNAEFNENIGLNLNGKPYCMIHQWERTPYRNYYYEKFKI